MHAKHNHSSIKPAGCSTHRKEALKAASMQTEIAKEFRKGSKINATLKGLQLNQKEFIFKPQNIWNVNAILKTTTMSSLTLTQALMKYLIEFFKWYVDSKKKELSDELQFLFFTSKCMQELLCEYYEVLVMNCTYKTNKYKMSLLIITGVTALNITFYVAFCFMKGENYGDYEWVMKALMRLYNYLDLSYSTTMIFNGDKALSSALSHVFAEKNHRVNHILCIWHINQNVTANCKKYFSINENWETFYRRWKNVVYSNTIILLKERYNTLHHDFSDAH